MVISDLTPFESRLYNYILSNDFETGPWITSRVAVAMGVSEEEIYKGLSELTKKIKDNIWIYYKAGELHVVAE
ncbi:MAG: hypothetical protein QCI82_07460 [Candidatus Thermoplasmatota archaeon]|nr:hypothetical protein [Candidatus Thermoplasmatota archaeon]